MKKELRIIECPIRCPLRPKPIDVRLRDGREVRIWVCDGCDQQVYQAYAQLVALKQELVKLERLDSERYWSIDELARRVASLEKSAEDYTAHMRFLEERIRHIMRDVEELEHKLGELIIKLRKRRLPDVAVIKGIGPKYARKLKAIGVENIADLVRRSPKEIASSLKISEKRVHEWVREAKKLLRELALE